MTKAFFSSQSILPPLNGTAGSLRTLLKTLLVTGGGATNVSSITVAGGVATVQHETSPGYEVYNCVTLAGVSETTLNGDHYVTQVPSANQWRFATTAPDGTYSGVITSRLGGLGWSALFESGDVLCLRSSHEDATGCVLRVDDSGATSARVRAYGAMSDVNTGTDPFPTVAQQAGGLYWPKAHNATGNRSWVLVADERAFYLYVVPTDGSAVGSLLGFGDIVGQSADAWGAFLAGHATELFTGGAGCLSAVSAAASVALTMPKAAGGGGGAVQARLMSGLRSSGVSGHATGSLLTVYPNVAHGDLVAIEPWVIAEDGLRGTLPGVLHTPQSIAVGERFMVPGLAAVQTSVGGAVGVAFLRLLEAWR